MRNIENIEVFSFSPLITVILDLKVNQIIPFALYLMDICEIVFIYGY